MKSSKRTCSLLMGACGLACAAAAIAGTPPGSPFVINVSGATLLRNFIIAPAATNEFVADLNTDGVIGGANRQLAIAGAGLPAPANQVWQLQYRGVGSVNGFIELRDWGRDGVYALNAGDLLVANASEGAWHNRTQYITTPVGLPPALVAPGNALNPGGAPVRSLIDGTFSVTNSTMAANAGTHIDVAPIDVPISWSVQVTGTPGPKRLPGTPGYGTNPRVAVMKDGAPTASGYMLPTLAPLNQNYAAPDNATAYECAIALAPVAAMVNYGVGHKELCQSDLKYLMATGRTTCGENLMVSNRDVGSGTHNAFCNSLCLDPSFGVGDNIGPPTSSSTNDLLGPNFQPGNKQSSTRVEGTVFQHRLALGPIGAERGIAQGWLGSRADVLGVKFDLINPPPATPGFVRPFIDNLLDNAPLSGYHIIGPAVMATVGDPLAAPASLGGNANGNPQVDNGAAAAYINNICKSITAFVMVPGGPATDFSPAEFLATNFILVAAADFIQDLANPCNIIPNPALNQNLQNVIRPLSTLGAAGYQMFNMTESGTVPTRTTLVAPNVYSDGQGQNATRQYIAQNGLVFGYAAVTDMDTVDPTDRNKVCGDFNFDGKRNCDDIVEMMNAWRFVNGLLGAWQPGTPACIGILGDFNGDGNFGRRFNPGTGLFDPDRLDVRFFADGLALDPITGKLNRCAGFEKVDLAFGGNFFGTILATGAPYSPAASAADVAGPAGLQARGFAPIGADGRVDAFDLDYICKNMGVWADQLDAEQIDLSCDINGDLVVDTRDKCKTVIQFLRTRFGDVNLDGVVDVADLAIANMNFGQMGGWAQGDADGDMQITFADIRIIKRGGTNLCCPSDLNADGVVNAGDLALLLGSWGPGNVASDLDGNNIVNAGDLALLLGSWGPCAM